MVKVDDGVVITHSNDDLVAHLEGLSLLARHFHGNFERLKVPDVNFHLIAADILDVAGDTTVSGKATVRRFTRRSFSDRRTALFSLAVGPFLCGTKSTISDDRRSTTDH